MHSSVHPTVSTCEPFSGGKSRNPVCTWYTVRWFPTGRISKRIFNRSVRTTKSVNALWAHTTPAPFSSLIYSLNRSKQSGLGAWPKILPKGPPDPYNPSIYPSSSSIVCAISAYILPRISDSHLLLHLVSPLVKTVEDIVSVCHIQKQQQRDVYCKWSIQITGWQMAKGFQLFKRAHAHRISIPQIQTTTTVNPSFICIMLFGYTDHVALTLPAFARALDSDRSKT